MAGLLADGHDGGVARKSKRKDKSSSRKRKKVLARLRKAEKRQRHVEIRLRDGDPVVGYVVGVDEKSAELAVLAETDRPDGTERVRVRDVVKVRTVEVGEPETALRGRFSYLEEVEELAQAVVDEAFEEAWPYDAQGVDELTPLQRAVRELACVVRRPEPGNSDD